jgi:putative redox protein
VSFSTKVADILKALAFMAERGTPARLLVGHSWGGAAALAAAGADPSVAAVATLAAPSDLNRHRHHLANIMKRATIEGSTPRTVGRRTLTLTRPFLENTHHASRNVADPDRPLLVVHTPDDATASMSRVRDLLLAASPPCTRTAPDDVDHVSASRAPGWIAAW